MWDHPREHNQPIRVFPLKEIYFLCQKPSPVNSSSARNGEWWAARGQPRSQAVFSIGDMDQAEAGKGRMNQRSQLEKLASLTGVIFILYFSLLLLCRFLYLSLTISSLSVQLFLAQLSPTVFSISNVSFLHSAQISSFSPLTSLLYPFSVFFLLILTLFSDLTLLHPGPCLPPSHLYSLSYSYYFLPVLKSLLTF